MAKNATPLKDRHLLTIPQVQAILGSSRESVITHVEKGDFAHIVEGKRKKIIAQSVKDYIDRESTRIRLSLGLPTAY